MSVIPPVKRHIWMAPKVNFNSSFILKRELGPRNVSLDRMPWPQSYTGGDCGDCDDFDGTEFRSAVTSTALALEKLSLALVPAYAEALDLPAGNDKDKRDLRSTI